MFVTSGDIMMHVGDTLSTVGDIMHTAGGTMMHVGDIMSALGVYYGYNFGFSACWGFNIKWMFVLGKKPAFPFHFLFMKS